ncbi:hypothetical protein [Roseivirga misakiensis]|uniref:Outer membrane protein beta-barrel domain-containing protein n=1 Tax=Roseivirga misakiensis TaxID=1563681 RepID=A0A1E5T4K9_9BACT|nr:hypothetical protein [Roseivirga misakiensis]OEK06333.1 hypothetical protein BFP71_01260 [Roseivirga misakiensis]
MKKTLYILTMFFTASIFLFGQETDKKSASIDITINPLAAAQKNELFGGMSIWYNKPINDRIVLGVEGFYSFGKNISNTIIDVTTEGEANVRDAHNIKMSLSLDMKYFLKEGVYEGHYFGARVNNLLTFASTREQLSFTASDRTFEALPMIGVYYGYRKTFLKSFFVDAAIGINPHFQPFRDVRINRDQVLDFRLTIGYRIPTGK